ncbi:MAG: amidohydrolase [Actinomycetes bacterium]
MDRDALVGADLLLRGGRPWPLGGVADVGVRDGLIDQIAPQVDAPGAEVLDVSDRLLLPGFVEAHCHLDKTMFGRAWVPHTAGNSLADRITTERRMKGELGLPDAQNVTALLERMVIAGTSYVRTHTDVDTAVGLNGVEVVREAARRLDGRVTVSQVAFPQGGVVSAPDVAELLDDALGSGVEAVGGIDPAGIDGDPVRHLDIVFGLAERHGAAIDIHLHDAGTLGLWELELIAERTSAAGLGGRVTVSHAYALAQADESTQDRLAERLAAAGVTLVTAAVYSFPVVPIRRLRAAGVNVACGHDGIRDLWGPYGTGDMLDRAMHVAYRSGFRRDEDIELALHAATYGGAQMLGLPAYGLSVGAPADIVVLAAHTPAEAVVTRPARDRVLKRGRVVARRGTLVT